MSGVEICNRLVLQVIEQWVNLSDMIGQRDELQKVKTIALGALFILSLALAKRAHQEWINRGDFVAAWVFSTTYYFCGALWLLHAIATDEVVQDLFHG